MTVFAGPLMPVTVVNTLGRVMPNHVVRIVRRSDGAEAALYLDINRTLAPTPYRTDEDGNLTGYFAEPGHYMLRATTGTDVPDVATAAVIAPEEADHIARQPGPQGPAGAEGTGTRRFQGHGAPTTIIGSRPGDEYLDLDTGDLYTLS